MYQFEYVHIDNALDTTNVYSYEYPDESFLTALKHFIEAFKRCPELNAAGSLKVIGESIQVIDTAGDTGFINCFQLDTLRKEDLVLKKRINLGMYVDIISLWLKSDGYKVVYTLTTSNDNIVKCKKGFIISATDLGCKEIVSKITEEPVDAIIILYCTTEDDFNYCGGWITRPDGNYDYFRMETFKRFWTA